MSAEPDVKNWRCATAATAHADLGFRRIRTGNELEMSRYRLRSSSGSNPTSWPGTSSSFFFYAAEILPENRPQMLLYKSFTIYHS
jgi:hypothetical protein